MMASLLLSVVLLVLLCTVSAGRLPNGAKLDPEVNMDAVRLATTVLVARNRVYM